MKTYKCLVIDPNGKKKTIFRKADNEEYVFDTFSSTGLIPLSIKEYTSQQKISAKNRKAVLEFTQMMEHLLNSGLSLKDAIEISAEINKSKRSKSSMISEELLSQINKGISFADSVSTLDSIFPPVYRGIIAVGDKVGSVEKIFPRLRVYLESSKAIRDKLSGALIYPFTILGTTIIGGIGLSAFVFPKLNTMFKEFGGDAGNKLESNIAQFEKISLLVALLVLILVVAGVFISIYRKINKDFSLNIEKTILSIPILGDILISWQTLHFCFAMETLVAGGVTIENAINEAKSVTTNEAYKEALQNVVSDIQKGISLSDAFASYSIFPTYLSKWIMVGEKSGKPDLVFSHLRNYYQGEIDRITSRFMTMIEPTLIILVGIFLLILVITVIVPIFSLYGSIL